MGQNRNMTDSDHLDPENRDLTVHDVAELTATKPAKVRALLIEGAFVGAYRTTNGPKGPWRIPRASLIDWRNRNR